MGVEILWNLKTAQAGVKILVLKFENSFEKSCFRARLQEARVARSS